DRLAIEIRREDLQRDVLGCGQGLERLFESDGQRISFLARRAPRHPRSEHGSARARRQNARQHVIFQVLPRVRIAEEARHAYQELSREKIDLARVLAEVAAVVRKAVDLMKPHAPLDAAQDGAALVEGEIVAGVRSEKNV